MTLIRQALLLTTGLVGLACLSLPAMAQQRYERDFPTIDYAGAVLSDPVSRLFADGTADSLAWNEERGYLDAVLEALGIDDSSQLLVFSKTSQKRRLITPEQPRALYFNDDVYVGFVQGGSTLEIAAMDPVLGPVFFELSQQQEGGPELERETSRCLRCHDSYSMTGGGTPRFMLSSVLAGESGEIVSHEVNFITDTAIPIRDRWGGWYVSGLHGEQRHLGNLIVRTGSDLEKREQGSNGNVLDLGDLVDLEPYPVATSDIVALLVIEHQVEVQNRITRTHYQVKTALDQHGMNPATEALIAETSEALLQSLLMVHEAPLQDSVTGTSGFQEYFEAQGPFDSEGRSLRELDLETRAFRFPLSYQIYSEAFVALPDPVREHVYGRLYRVLSGTDQLEGFAAGLRESAAALSILQATHEEFAAFVERNAY